MLGIARSSLLSSLVLASSILAGCTAFAGDDVVRAKLEVARQAESTLPASGVTAINGIYGSTCEGRSAGDKWSVGIDSSAMLDNEELRVRKNDVDCALTLTGIVVNGTPHAGDDAIALGSSYAPKAARFAASSPSSTEFFANARIDSLSFAADFTISLSVATKAFDAQSGEKTSAYATHSATLAVADVPAPSYAIDLSDFTLVTDATDTVVSSSGHAKLVAGSTAGQSYAIHHGTLTAANSPTAIAAAMSDAAVSGPLSDLTSLQIPHSQLDLDGKSLSTSIVRTLIIRNVDESSNVASFQLITVTFSKP